MEGNTHTFDIILPVAPKDVGLLRRNIKNLLEKTGAEKIVVVANKKYKDLVPCGGRIEFLDEDSLVENMNFENVRKCIAERDGPENRAGWYLQQFLKMAWAYRSDNDYYLIWDGDTILLNKIAFWENTPSGEKCLFTLKEEYVYSYFATLKNLFNGKVKKMPNSSFIAEHMMINKNIMLEMIKKIEENGNIHGSYFWEKIINGIDKKYLYRGFSEFETYGNYVLAYYPEQYGFRRLRTFRNGAMILNSDSINDDILKWMSKSIDTVSLESWNYRGFFYKLALTLVPLTVKYKIPYWCCQCFHKMYDRLYCTVLFYKKLVSLKPAAPVTEERAKIVFYIGCHNPFTKRGPVEDEIYQASGRLSENIKKCYLFIDSKQPENVMMWDDLFCYGVKSGAGQFAALNRMISKIKWMDEHSHITIYSHNVWASTFLSYPTNVLTIHDKEYHCGNSVVLKLLFPVVKMLAGKKSRKVEYHGR